jgi:SH3-like domain-containing protein
MRGTGWILAGLATALLTIANGANAKGTDAAKAKRAPYFASIEAGRARMRTGPGRTYPSTWLYQRADLPVKVLDSYEDWRKIEDPDGTQGWMLSNLISARRTAMVVGQNLDMLDAPRFGAKVVWRAAPGVVGRLSHCARGWCSFDVHGRSGYIEANRVWGVEADEMFE